MPPPYTRCRVRVVERVLKLALPNLYCWLCIFYGEARLAARAGLSRRPVLLSRARRSRQQFQCSVNAKG